MCVVCVQPANPRGIVYMVTPTETRSGSRSSLGSCALVSVDVNSSGAASYRR